MTRRMRTLGAALLCSLPLLAPARHAAAADKTWIGGSGNWSVNGNWAPFGRPQSFDNVFLTSTDLIARTVTYDLPGPFLLNYGNITIQTQQFTNMELRQPGTSLEASSLSLSSFHDFGSARHVVSDGGNAHIGSLTIGASGSISVSSGGVYDVRDAVQFNGAVAVEAGSTFTVGGTYTFIGGTFAGPLTVRSTGALHLNSGPFGATITNFGAIVLNNSTSVQGLTNHAAVTVPAGRLFEAGFIDHRGATITQAGDVRTSELTVHGGSTWTQLAGNTEGSGTVIGDDAGPGTYVMGAGTHAILGLLIVGQSSAGSFLQNGGTVRATLMSVGGAPTIGFGRGYYRLSGGSLVTSGQLLVGSENSLGGTFEQTGGTSDFFRFHVNVNSTTSGAIKLAGGTLRTTISSINNGSLDISGGALRVDGSLDGAGSVSVTGTGSLSLERIRQNSLFVGGDGRVFNTSTSGRPATNRVGSLTFEEPGGGSGAVAGTLDLGINSLVIDYAGGAGASPIINVRRYLRSARGTGSWNGTGLTSSFSASTLFPLGYIEATEFLGAGGGTFGDLTVDGSAVLVRATFYGDANLDSRVNLLDFNRLAANFGGANKVWSQGDFNYDGSVNLLDFNLLASKFGMIAGPALSPGDWAALAGAIPEPSRALGGMAASAAMCGRRRRRLASA